MAASLERRTDDSMALFIDGDLQFDSHDECIYHEGLALPALAIAQKRKQSDLRVLIIGGGDGLVAREILKSANVASVDLVDYDPDILALAKNDLLELNKASLLDHRVTVHVQDAWQFIDELIERRASFDLIISDLTVADNVEGARFHSIEWYGKLERLLAGQGVLAVNAVSPQATPEAYWSIFNGMLRAGLHAKPYHIHLPSFSALGYGQDWGFFLASAQPIVLSELTEKLPLVQPTKFLKDAHDIHKLFFFPEEVFAFQAESVPAFAGSDVLLRYFNNCSALSETSGVLRDSFSLDTFNLSTPEADSRCEILSAELTAALAASIYSSQGSDSNDAHDVELILNGVLELMPSLEREQTSRLISDFLERPEIFLKAIDLPGLVSRLLRRAAELPACIVEELELLRDKLTEWAGDHLTLLSLSRRIVTVLTLTIVIGNVLYPDMAYAKGGHDGGHDGGHSAAGHEGDRGHTGERGRTGARGVGGGTWGGGGVYGGGRYWNGTRWINGAPVAPVIKNSLPQPNDVSDAHFLERTDSAQSRLVAESQPSELGRAAFATRNMMLAARQELTVQLTLLSSELNSFELSENMMVTYGSHELPRVEAIRLTKLACHRTQEQIKSLGQQIARLDEQSKPERIAELNIDATRDV